jgi:hypothetical protein
MILILDAAAMNKLSEGVDNWLEAAFPQHFLILLKPHGVLVMS